MTKHSYKVKHAILPSINLDILRQFRRLNRGKDGLMFNPIRKVIAYKMGKAFPLSIVKKMHESRVAYIEIDGVIASWALLLFETPSILEKRCEREMIRDKLVKYEIHIFTHKSHRGKGYATRIAKSIKRKYPKTKFLAYWDESSIFCKNNLVNLISREKELAIKSKYSNMS